MRREEIKFAGADQPLGGGFNLKRLNEKATRTKSYEKFGKSSRFLYVKGND
jgi:hypothetical protein